MKTIAIIGGGAGGLAAAVAAGEAVRGSDVRVVLFEASDRVGRSILASGNGRCNFSNAHIDASAYYNAHFVEQVLDSFEATDRGEEFPNGVVKFFFDHGLLWHEEGEGRLYPQANKASVVLDVLRTSMDAANVEVRTEAQVDFVKPENSGFGLHFSNGNVEHADSVIVACGGNVARSIVGASLGFAVPTPMLGPVATDTKQIKKLDGIRVRCVARLKRAGQTIVSEQGEVLFRKYGVSGIAIFNLSRHMQKGDLIKLDLIPRIDESYLPGFLEERAELLEMVRSKTPTNAELFCGMLLPKVSQALLSSVHIDENEEFNSANAVVLADACKAFALKVKGIGDAKQCQVHRGGFDVQEFASDTLEAREVPGLYVIGEALDVDGPCGGYNLHWAFATGVLAARNAAARLMG